MRDVIHALRSLGRSRSVTAMIVVVLALGIGASTAMFSIIDGVLLRPLPYHDPSRLVVVWDREIKASGVSKLFDSYADFRAVSGQASAFSEVAAATWAVDSRLLTRHGTVETVLAMPVTQSFFPLLGVAPAQGRTFIADDDQRGCSAVLSHQLWQASLGADSKLVGGAILLDDHPCSVVGIMPPGFAFYPQAAGMWVLLTPHFTPPPDSLPVGIFARLRPGATMAQAQAEVSQLHTSLHRATGGEQGLAPVVYNLQEEFAFLAEADLKTTLWILTGAVGLVLLIGCLNIATLLLSQALGRHRELSVRLALGSGRRRIVRQLLTESLALAAVGGAVGVAIAFALVGYFRAINPVEMPVGARVQVRVPVLLFAVVLSGITAILFGLVPAWRASRVDVIDGLKGGGRGGIAGARGLVRGLVTAELALSLVLLAGAGLLIESFFQMGQEPLGFQPSGMSVAEIRLSPSRYPDSAARLSFYDKVLSGFGTRGMIATSLPPDGPGIYRPFFRRGVSVTDSADVPRGGRRIVSAGYFSLLGVQVLRGRAFDDQDRATSEPVCIIDASLARSLFGERDPVGQMLGIGMPNSGNPWRRIIGVVADQKTSSSYHQIGWIERPEAFVPLAQDPPPSAQVALRGSPNALHTGLQALDEVAVGNVETMQEHLARFLAYPRLRAMLFAAFAGFALLLAGVGLYSVLRQFVVERRQEIGVRVAIGATPGDVVRLIGRQTTRPLITGIMAGVVGTLLLGRYLASLLYHVAPSNPAMLIVVCAVMLVISVIAMWFPARSAARVDPLVAIRTE